MSTELTGVLILVAVFVLSSVRGLNMGVLALVAAFLFGCAGLGRTAEDVLDGFPAEMFVVLVAVTFLFGIARVNGTVDWLVHAAVRAAGHRAGVVPWILFLVAALLCATGAASPAAVAIVAPIGVTFAVRHGLAPLYAGLMAVNGAAAGSFSPTGILGGIVNSTVSQNDLSMSGGQLFAGTFAFNLAVAGVTWLFFRRRHVESPPPTAPRERADTPATAVGVEQAATLAAMIGLLLGTTVLSFDTGFTALTLAAALALFFRPTAQKATQEIAWPVVLLVCGIVTYIAFLQTIGVVDSLGTMIADIGAPLLAALIICYVGGVVSAFASTTGILGALMPLAVPFLASGAIGTTEMVIALAASATVVDASPFSTNGALVIANTPEPRREDTYRGLLRWGAGVCALAPVTAWFTFVVL
ncbi:SLC13 family permease [Streptomyces radicis]|uniref:C4-dicarboxylate ABC transporter n=1 Tax=Streptomyces radicis TaxID=1750517 RepID=A0A3A9WSA0_9ACTN|nr:SLC13 family permease [Streptomyces radicis]RKN12424.1 C4-dicarboxylate ABC transporter [Streptomyces radicis]RKN27806.1 C4-dicarboxylate ABC transporter [Streptomyces radicis]